MTERDESKDVAVDFDHNMYTDSDGHDVTGKLIPFEVVWATGVAFTGGADEDGIETVRYVPHAQYAELEAQLAKREDQLEEETAMANRAVEERDRLREELEKLRSKPSVNTKMGGEYYIIDNRGTVGNCASFWAVKGNGYCCNIEEAGLFKLNYSDRETDVQVPREVVETCIVKHVRLDAIRSEMKKRGLEFKGGRLK